MATITDEERAIIDKLRQNIKGDLPLSVTSMSAEDQDLFLVRWILPSKVFAATLVSCVTNLNYMDGAIRVLRIEIGESRIPVSPTVFTGLDRLFRADDLEKLEGKLFTFIARDLNLEKATNMLRNSLKWRIENRADDALNFKLHPFFAEYFVVKFSGTDKLGHPVFIVPLNEWDLRKVVNDADRLAGFDDFATNFFEVMCKHIKDEHNKRKEAGQQAITQMTILLDVQNYSYMQLVNFGAIKKLLQIAAIYEAHYPEILYRAVFINCPIYFGMFIAILKPVLAPKTMGKIVCYPKMSEWQNDIKETVDPAQIPERYGGTKISE